jgi:hypothetical protein
MFRRKMALEKAEGSLEKVAMGIHESEKEGIKKVSALLGNLSTLISIGVYSIPTILYLY